MSIKNKLTQLARSPKGRELIDKAQTMANDPKNREKLDGARQKIEGQIGAAKQKLAEKRGDKDGAGQPGEPAAAEAPAAPPTTPATPPPGYRGDDGPKAA